MNEEEFLHGDGGAEQEAQNIKELEDELKMLRAFWKWSREVDKTHFWDDYKREK